MSGASSFEGLPLSGQQEEQQLRRVKASSGLRPGPALMRRTFQLGCQLESPIPSRADGVKAPAGSHQRATVSVHIGEGDERAHLLPALRGPWRLGRLHSCVASAPPAGGRLTGTKCFGPDWEHSHCRYRADLNRAVKVTAPSRDGAGTDVVAEAGRRVSARPPHQRASERAKVALQRELESVPTVSTAAA